MKGLARFDHPLVFLIVMTLGVYAVGNLLGVGFRTLGWSGPAAFFHQ